MMSVSQSLAFLLSVNEMSSGLRGRLSGVWSAAPAPPRDLVLTSPGPTPGLAAALCGQLSCLLTPMSSECQNAFPDTTNCSRIVFSPACKCFSCFTDSMCVFCFNPSPFPFLSLWVLSSFSDFYSNPTFSPKPSLIIQARVFFLPRILATVGFIWISPLTAWCPGYLCGYLVPSEEAYTAKITYSFLQLQIQNYRYLQFAFFFLDIL